MGALSNAVDLMQDDIFFKWCRAAGAYQARKVITEAATEPSHDVRLRMAQDVIANPDIIAARLVNAIACDPAVATKGNTPAQVTEDTVITKAGEVWTKLAEILYPTPTV